MKQDEAHAEPRVCAIVVSFNRLPTLRLVIDALLAQTRAPDLIIVVDNGSTDGSTAYLRGLNGAVHLIESESNGGGAGGFMTGVAFALRCATDFLWLMDDDAVPAEGCLAELLAAATCAESVPFFAPMVTDAAGNLGPRNRPWLSPSIPEQYAAAVQGQFSILASSFVGPLIRAADARETALPRGEFFIWHDDTEYTARLALREPGRAVPSARIAHLVSNSGTTSFVPERAVRNIRNLVWCIRLSSESAIARRSWVRSLLTTVRGQFRSLDSLQVYARAAWAIARGFAAGLGPRPRDKAAEAVIRASLAVDTVDARLRVMVSEK